MGLEMRAVCERCHAALDLLDGAFICSYECTFCADCTVDLMGTCSNCGGELVPRPRRPASAAPECPVVFREVTLDHR